MVFAARPRSLARLLTLVALAYVLVLNGLLGSIAAGAHVTEARTAAQLGVICTIHGISNGGSGQADDPTPGKLACIEHCVLASAGIVPAVLPAGSMISLPEADAEAAGISVVDQWHRIASVATPPPSRGPPRRI